MFKSFDLYHCLESNFFSMISKEQLHNNHFIAFDTGMQVAGLNLAIVKNIHEGFPASLDACQTFYEEKGLPWALVLPDYLRSKSIEKLIEQYNFVFEGEGMAMALPLNKIIAPPTPPSFTIYEMNNNLKEWSFPLIEAFESTPEKTAVYTARHQTAIEKKALLYHFSGFIENTIVCSLSLSLCDKSARIDDVATLPAYQNKGYATALMYKTLQYAQELKINTCFLEASTVGLNLYKRMGFEALFINRYYEFINSLRR